MIVCMIVNKITTTHRSGLSVEFSPQFVIRNNSGDLNIHRSAVSGLHNLWRPKYTQVGGLQSHNMRRPKYTQVSGLRSP